MTKQDIRNLIRDQEVLSRAARGRIRDSHGMDRWQAWNEKRAVGDDTRSMLLALAMLKGRFYHVVERRTHTKPSVREVVHYSGASQADVEAWLSDPLAEWIQQAA